MTPARAERLAQRTQSRRDDGGRGLRARYAWRLLVQAGDRYDLAAAEAVWRALLRCPDDELWAALSRWRTLATLTEDLSAAAAAPGRDRTERAALIGFCVRHGLAPRDAVRRAGFFALTGQPDQRRALDPDGSLLAAAYQAADPVTRSSLREALAEAGDLDVVRVVAGADSRGPSMTAEERRYLCGQLAGRRDWAGLWRLAQELPAADAVAAVGLIDERWRPAGQHDRNLYGLLTRFDGETARTARAALTGPVRLIVPGQVLAGALSANGRRLAAATIGDVKTAEGRRVPATISVFDLPRGGLVMRYHVPLTSWCRLGYAGRTLIVMDSRLRRAGASSDECLLYRCRGVQPMELAFREHAAFDLIAARRHGFVLCGYDDTKLVLSFHHADGRRFLKKRIGDSWGMSLGWGYTGRSLASDIGSGRLLATNGGQTILLNAAHAQRLRVGKQYLNYDQEICFYGRDHVIAAQEHGIVRRQVDDLAQQGASGQASAELRGGRSLLLVAARDEICALSDHRRVVYLDANSLRRTPGPLSGATGTTLWSSADNACHALGDDGLVHAVTRELLALQDLADRPQAAWVPGDLLALRKASALVRHYPGAWPLYDLLLGCLEHRFGEAVRLGRLSRDGLSPMADDDIGIGEVGDAD